MPFLVCCWPRDVEAALDLRLAFTAREQQEREMI